MCKAVKSYFCDCVCCLMAPIRCEWVYHVHCKCDHRKSTYTLWPIWRRQRRRRCRLKQFPIRYIRHCCAYISYACTQLYFDTSSTAIEQRYNGLDFRLPISKRLSNSNVGMAGMEARTACVVVICFDTYCMKKNSHATMPFSFGYSGCSLRQIFDRDIFGILRKKRNCMAK